MERYLEDALAEDILRGVFKDAPVIHVKADNQKLLFFPEAKEEGKERNGSAEKKDKEKERGKRIIRNIFSFFEVTTWLTNILKS